MGRPRGDEVFAAFQGTPPSSSSSSSSSSTSTWASLLASLRHQAQGYLGREAYRLHPGLLLLLLLVLTLLAFTLTLLPMPSPDLDYFSTATAAAAAAPSSTTKMSSGAGPGGAWPRPLGASPASTLISDRGVEHTRSASPSWLSLLLSQLLQVSNCGSGPSNETKEKPGFAEEGALRSALEKSEEQYEVNLKARLDVRGGRLSPGDPMDELHVRSEMLVPLYPCPLEGRFGLWGEGGKWVCLGHRRRRTNASLTVISVGSAGDFSFEKDVAERLNGFSHTFDMTLSADKQHQLSTLPFLKFHSVGLSGARALAETQARFPGASIVTVREAVEMTGRQYVDIFKIDCEGCEFELVKDMVEMYNRSNVPFGQILMEEHLDMSPVHLPLLLGLEELGYRMFHSEINAFALKCYELAWVHESLCMP